MAHAKLVRVSGEGSSTCFLQPEHVSFIEGQGGGRCTVYLLAGSGAASGKVVVAEPVDTVAQKVNAALM